MSKHFSGAAAAAFVLLGVTAHAATPRWTILHQVCWKLSPTAGQCAVGLQGVFATRAECIAANNGQLEQKGEQNGMQVGYRCEMLLE